jgi:hypothetical protein
VPDHKSIAEFRRMNGEAVSRVGAELVRFARAVGLVRGEWVAIDGSKFRAASSSESVRERRDLERYLGQMEQADAEEEIEIDPRAVAAALKKLRRHPEPEARFMRTGNGKVPAYNVQTVVDAEHALIVTEQVTVEATDNRSLQPMGEAAQAVLGGAGTPIHVVADAGCSNGEQAEACKNRGIIAHVPAVRGVNNRETGRCLGGKIFSTTKPATRFVVRPVNVCAIINARIVGSFTRAKQKPCDCEDRWPNIRLLL